MRETAHKIMKRRKQERAKRLNETALKKSYSYKKMKRDQRDMRKNAKNHIRRRNKFFQPRKTEQSTLDS